MKYVIKATKFTDDTFNKVVFENKKISRKVDTFSEAVHILNLDYENATEQKMQIEFSGTELITYNEDGTILQEWIEKIA